MKNADDFVPVFIILIQKTFPKNKFFKEKYRAPVKPKRSRNKVK